MLSDLQSLFLLIYSVTYVTTLANWPVDSFATAAMVAHTEYDEKAQNWVRSNARFLTKSRSRFIVATLFGSVIPLCYLGIVMQVLAPPLTLFSSSPVAAVLRTVLVGLTSLTPHAFHRLYLFALIKWQGRLVDFTRRFREYLNNREGGALTKPRHHLIGASIQFVVALASLLLLLFVGTI